MKEASLPLQTSPTLRELPPRAPALNKANQIFALQGRVLLGEVFVGLGGGELLQSAAVALVLREEAICWNALRECRDSACRRPFGVRRNAAGVCSEMTRRGDFYVKGTI